jgi:hypothetical protein
VRVKRVKRVDVRWKEARIEEHAGRAQRQENMRNSRRANAGEREFTQEE